MFRPLALLEMSLLFFWTDTHYVLSLGSDDLSLGHRRNVPGWTRLLKKPHAQHNVSQTLSEKRLMLVHQ